MTRNIALVERVIRGLVGVGLLGLYGALPAPWKYFALLDYFRWAPPSQAGAQFIG